MKKKLAIVAGLIILSFVIIYLYKNYNWIEIDTSYKKLYKQIKKNTTEYNDKFKIYKASDYDSGDLLGMRVDHKHESVTMYGDDLVNQYKYSKKVAEIANYNKDKINTPAEISILFIENGPWNSSGQDTDFLIKSVEGKYSVEDIRISNNYYKFEELEILTYTDISYLEYWGRDVHMVSDFEFLSKFSNLEEIYIGSYTEGDAKSISIRKRIHDISPNLTVVFHK